MKKFPFTLILILLSSPTAVLSQIPPSTTTETGLTIHPELPAPESAATVDEMAMDVDVSGTTDADTFASGMDETGSLDQDTTGSNGNLGMLPDTASNTPLVSLLGIFFLLAAVAIRLISRRRRA